MKILSLTIQNVGAIESETIQINKPLLIFYGAVREGKSTILNAIRWCLGGEWPADIIRHGADEAEVTLVFDSGSVKRSWYRGRDNETKAREIVFILNGQQVRKPAGEIAKLLNPFVTHQNYLASMSEPARKAFFAQILGADTSALDSEADLAAEEAKGLRAAVKAYGEFEETITIPPTKPADPGALEAERDMVKDEYDQEVAAWRTAVWEVDERKHQRESCSLQIIEIRREIQNLEERLTMARDSVGGKEQWLKEHPPLGEIAEPMEPERLKVIDLQLRTEGEIRAKYAQWEKDIARYNQKREAEARLKKLENRQRDIKEQKAAMLKDYAANAGIPGLAFDEKGEVIFEETTAGMLSTSQLMRLSTALAAKYPPGFGLELIDRAESLGQSIYDLINDAQARERTILATVVGDSPAQSPPEVGVFVVKGGKITPK